MIECLSISIVELGIKSKNFKISIDKNSEKNGLSVSQFAVYFLKDDPRKFALQV